MSFFPGKSIGNVGFGLPSPALGDFTQRKLRWRVTSVTTLSGVSRGKPSSLPSMLNHPCICGEEASSVPGGCAAQRQQGWAFPLDREQAQKSALHLAVPQ